MMNFSGSCRPDFSVPPPPIPMPTMTNGVRGVGIPGQFPRYSGPLHNQLSPFLQPPRYANNQSNSNLQGIPNFNPRGGAFQHNSGNRQVTPSNHIRQQVNYNSGNVFDSGTNNVNSVKDHSFPFCMSQQPNNNSNTPNRHSQFNQRGFQNNRGRGGSRGRSRFMNNNNYNNKNNNTNNYNGNQGQAKKKKEKIDKRDLPENNLFFCDICDRGFKTQEKYQEHIDGHQKCSYKDCPFVAAPKLVQLHMTMQHYSGLAKRIWNVESEEDIRKWREERRRNYPTAANIKKKKELQAEKIQRGEVLETKDFSKMKRGQNRNHSQGRGRGHGRGNRRHRRHRGRFQHGETREGNDVSDEDDDGPPIEMKIIRSSDPTEVGNLEESNGDQDEKRDSIKTGSHPTVKDRDIPKEESETIVNGLSLLAGYGGDDSSDDPSSDDEDVCLDGSNSSKPLPQDDDASGVRLPKSFMCKEEAPSTPLELQHESTSAHQPGSPDSLSSGSPHKSYEKDPFNLTNISNSSTFSSPSNHNPNNLVGNSDKGATTNVSGMEKVDKKPLDSHNSKSFLNRHTANGLDLKEYGKSPSLSTSALLEVSSKKFPSSSHSPETKDEKKGTKRNYDKPFSDVDKGINKTNFRQEKVDNKKRKIDHRHQPKTYTLLEKLLAPQIRRERNKILQCVYYIVKSKFFDDNSKNVTDKSKFSTS